MRQMVTPSRRNLLRNPLGHMRRNVVAYLALFVALGGTSAYAANEWNSSNIQNETLLSEDVKNGTLKAEDYGIGSVSGARIQDNNVTTLDLADGAIFSNDVRDNSLTGADVQNFSLGTSDIADNSIDDLHVKNETLGTSEIRDNSLTGTDINESSLSMPPTTTAAFAGNGNVAVGNSYNKIVDIGLGGGSYAITATANVSGFSTNAIRDTFCELRNPSGEFIGGARDGRVNNTASLTVSLSMNGGVQVPAGGGEVGLYCRYDGGTQTLVGDGQIMVIRVDGFS